MNARDELFLRLPDTLWLSERDGLLDAYRDETRAERDAEIVAWLGKKAREFHSAGGKQREAQADAVGAMASKLERGAVRSNNMLGADTRADVLRRMADAAGKGTREGEPAELTATLNVDRSESRCGHCGEPTLVTGVTHHTDISGWAPRPGGGCGARFTAIAAANSAVTPEVLRDMRPDLPVHDRKDTRESGSTQPADFFQPGHTYSGDHGWKFRVDAVTTHPEDNERTALGWRSFKGEWEPYAYGEDDWEIHQLVGVVDVTEAGEAR